MSQTGRRKRILFALVLGTLCLSNYADRWDVFTDSLIVDEAVPEDAFLIANDISASGSFEEDLWAAGRKIELSGWVKDDVRIAALEVLQVDGKIGGEAHLISSLGNIVLNTNALLEATAVLQAGKRIVIKGQVNGDVWAEAPRVVIEGEIGGDLTVNSKTLQLLPGAMLRGDLITPGNQPIPIPEGVTLLGERRQETVPPSESSTQLQQLAWILTALQAITAFFLGILLLKLFPRFTGNTVDLLLHRQGPLVSIGLLSLVTFLIIGYFLLLTVIGTGVGLFILIITGLMYYLGKIFVAFVIGMMLLRQTTDLVFKQLILALLLGLAVLYTLGTIPYIGGSIMFVASCWGMGALLVSLRLSQKPLHFHIPTSKPDQTP